MKEFLFLVINGKTFWFQESEAAQNEELRRQMLEEEEKAIIKGRENFIIWMENSWETGPFHKVVHGNTFWYGLKIQLGKESI